MATAIATSRLLLGMCGQWLMVLLVGWASICFVAFIVFQGFVMLIHLVWGSSPARPNPDSLIAFILAWPALVLFCRPTLNRARVLARLPRWKWRRISSVDSPLTLYYTVELGGQWNLTSIYARAVEETYRMGLEFGAPLPSRVRVLLMSSPEAVSELCGQALVGAALGANTLVLPGGPMLWTTLRHELTHSFTAQWSFMTPPPLLVEGIATWLEQPDNHKLVDEISRTTHCSLRGLRDRDYFYSDDVHYALAASFTGFLLRRFGWNAYRNLYRSSGVAFKAAFKTELGISFSNAEREWRQELLTQSVSR